MSATEHERMGDDVGAYLLGSLTELEQKAFERHLMACEECRRELARLRPAADAIAHAVEQFEAPPTLKRSLMSSVEEDARAATGATVRRRRRRRLSLPALRLPQLAGAAAAVLLVGVAIGFAVDRASRDDSSSGRVVAAATRLPGAGARLHVGAGDGAATLRVTGMPVLRDGRVYEVWIQHDGVVRPAGALFAVHADGSGAAAIPHPVERGDRVMVTRERAGGVATPTEMPLIVAQA